MCIALKVTKFLLTKWPNLVFGVTIADEVQYRAPFSQRAAAAVHLVRERVSASHTVAQRLIEGRDDVKQYVPALHNITITRLR